MVPKSKLFNYIESFIIFCICLLTILLPFAVSDKIINGIQSGKFFFFCYSIIGLIGIFSLNQLFKNFVYFKTSVIDYLFYVFILWVSINKFFLHEVHSFSFRYYELLFLGGLYLIIRNIRVIYFPLILIGICISGIGQAVYGNFQLWGFYPSLHGLFQITGSFFNPGPYAGYLCAIMPIAVGLYWNLKPVELKIDLHKKYSIRYLFFRIIAIATIISISLVLPAAQSRAAWLGAIAGILFLAYHHFNVYAKVSAFIYKNNGNPPLKNPGFRSRQLILGSAAIVLIGIICLGLYKYKKGSADGRVLIWTVTTNIIKDNPITGVGQDQFKAHYCDYQADFFRTHSGSPFESLAVDNQYVFNEFLNIWVEDGLVGLLLFVALLFFVFNNRILKKNFITQSDNNSKENQISQLLQIHPIQMGKILKASMLSIIVFSCFAYPSEILPIKVVAVVCLAMLSIIINLNKQDNQPLKQAIPPLWMKISTLLLITILLGVITIHLRTLQKDCITWNNAYNLYVSERYEDCLKEYGKAWPSLKENGDFLLNYGKALSMAGKHEKAIEVLERSKTYSTNSTCYTSLGDSYFALGQNSNAEAAYKNAHDIAPAKFYPEYLLAKYYYKAGDTRNAILMAQKVLQKQIKIKSKAIEEITQEMLIILNNEKKFQHRELSEANQPNNSGHSHEDHHAIVPYRLVADTCSDGCTVHNHLNKKEVQ